MSSIQGFNLLRGSIACPRCGHAVEEGVGFRAGAVDRRVYKLGDSLSWQGGLCHPAGRPEVKQWHTIGYFECENLKCSSWSDCFPEVNEVLITIEDDVIKSVKTVVYKPNLQEFPVFLDELPGELAGQ